MHIDLRNADVSEIAQLAGFSGPISGAGDLVFNVTGTRAHPTAEGRIEIRDAMVYGASIPLLRSDLHFADDELQFNNLATTLYDAPVTGNGALNLSSSQFRANLSGRNLDLIHFPKLQTSRFAVDGRADFTAKASGTLEQPTVEAHLHIRDLAFDKERAGDLYLDAVPRGRQLEIQGHSDFEKADLKLRGTIGMENEFPADLDFSFQNLDIDALLNIYLPGKITAHSTLAGTVALHGPLRNSRTTECHRQPRQSGC